MNVVVADDDHTARFLVERLLRSWGYSIQSFERGDEALAALRAHDESQIAVLDWMMPGMDGIDVARNLRAVQRESYTYIVLITSRNARSDYLQALSAGADDLLSKPFDPHELKARLHVGQRILTLQGGLRFQAMHDQLTGALNRVAILKTLDEEIARSRREHAPLSVIMCDVDHFKQVNDTHGHMVGDEVLREVANRMRLSLRNYDKFGRFGGEEFLLVTPGVNLSDAWTIAERTRMAVADSPIQTANGPVNVTISLGVSTVVGGVTDALHAADMALYCAKSAGRNVVMTPPGVASSSPQLPLL